ncbi:EF-hand domain-containing protein [Rhizobium binxianense]|uniref:EF-hand domain-containing protein n=1 Tax=Rhizobium binxianense TaxID=3024242 RepID=UPI00236195FB|nr:EF-hand domain-containing protein [Rhizobium sp. MJ37]MDC9837354.1 EF-hand domain-containing protein [Rhizobium sp. MJ37]
MVSAKKSTATQQSDEDSTNSAEKLMAQLMSLAMNGLTDQSGSSQGEDGGAGADVAQLDSDGDGYASKAEFVAARPSADDDQSASLLSELDANGDGLVTLEEFMAGKPEDVTESQASQLFDLLDTSGTGSLSTRATG